MRPIFQLSICCDSSGPATEPRKGEGEREAELGRREREGKDKVGEKEREKPRERHAGETLHVAPSRCSRIIWKIIDWKSELGVWG